jgi:hypothetical protein
MALFVSTLVKKLVILCTLQQRGKERREKAHTQSLMTWEILDYPNGNKTQTQFPYPTHCT